MTDVVTAEQVELHFTRSAHTRELVSGWERDHRDDEVVDAVRRHHSKVVNSVTLNEVEQVCRTTDHALGRVRGEDADSVPAIRDWTSPFAVSHVFHFITEAVGTVPTYQLFQKTCQMSEFRHMLWEPAIQAIEDCIQAGTPSWLAHDAIRWRIGNFYYSFLREQWTHAYLRSSGIVTRQHPLADALFAVDGWVDDKVISIYIGNRTFRTSAGGRKHGPRVRLRGAQPPFGFVDMQLPAATRFGRVHLPDRRRVDEWIHRQFRRHLEPV
ncbi:hypothetical protein [Actinoplanes awajinensis]|uniref:Uncharacterized protein n=1 Tax=Actinoplanes awajinensis subsp. mycoplanecinus TaxID=135947 RepID=A0A101JS53_9ACTN|nr:hypothetical protein [Actinoplanes awajinensis]KUL31446.1 hypothetical protein ADL15_22195 [Actinoplanes awajinensis subsp. mycoplanecinus]